MQTQARDAVALLLVACVASKDFPMKRIKTLVGRVAVCTLLLATAAIAQSVAQPRERVAGPGGEPEPSRCLTATTMLLSANPAQVKLGQPSVVNWSVSLPADCSGIRVRFNGDTVTASGNRQVTPSQNSTYTLTVSETHLGVFGQKSRSTQVTVTYPERVVIDGSTRDPAGVLIGAMSESDPGPRRVELCNVDINLTGRSEILIGSNRSLIAAPGCERGPRSLGPRIFVTDTRGSKALFDIRGDNVLIAGFRLQGPTDGIAQGDTKERGLRVNPEDGETPIRNIEISNMEIFHWSGAAVAVTDNVKPMQRGRLFNTNERAVRISNNFIHHNRHGSGYGYGVVVGDGGYALISQNVFDENRHAVAGDSKNENGLDYSGYTVRDNLILEGGGRHCSESWWGALTGWGLHCWQTHQIDMHGDENEWYSSHNWQCGTAGETMIIQRNTILYSSGYAIKIRGNPADKAVVDGNVFKFGSRSDAIAQNGACGWGDNITNPINVLPNNEFGVDPMAQLGSCDFFGDGRPDQFMATGNTWWAKSPSTGQWRYMNTMRERLPQLLLGRVDNDSVCDVALRPANPAMAPRAWSKSGKGPWLTRDVLQQ